MTCHSVPDEKIIHVRPLPAFAGAVGSEARADAFLERLRGHAVRYAGSPGALFGCELRIAGALEVGQLVLTSPSSYPAAPIVGISGSSLYIRPAIEPVLHALAPALTASAPGNELVRQLASCLCGHPVGFRDRGNQTSLDRQNTRSRYPDVGAEKPLIQVWQDSIAGLSSDKSLAACLFRYFNFLALHPFRDGNGRTARALLLADLALAAGVSLVPLPLGAVKYAWTPIYTQSVRRLSVEPEAAWPDFVSLMLTMLETALALADALYDGRIPAANRRGFPLQGP